MDIIGSDWPLLIYVLLATALVVRTARVPLEPALARFAQRHGLTLTAGNRSPVAVYLRRARVLRSLGGSLGLLVPMLVTVTTRGRVQLGGWELVLLGYLLGAAAAEALVARRPPTGERRASLAPRLLTSYLPRWTRNLRWLLVLTAAALAAWHAVLQGLTAFPGGPLGALAGCLAVAAASELALRAVVGRPQPMVDADLLAADDALRASSLQALAGAAVAIELLLVADQWNGLGVLAQSRGGDGRVFFLLAVLMLAGAVTAWSALRQPRVTPRARATA